MADCTHYIDGERVPGSGARFGDIFDPATGKVQGRIPFASPEDIENTIASALGAFPAWAEASPMQRARVLARFAALMAEHKDELAALVSSEHGKVRSDAAGSVQRGLEVAEFASGIPHLVKGEFSSGVSRGIDMYSLRKPLGVVAGITPFNFPVMVPCWMFTVAIACGNTFILKPSEKDPSAAVRLAELLTEAGAPKGVLNVLQGDKAAVDGLLDDPRVEAVSFVGSTPIAQYVYNRAAETGKRCQAMGGAKNHMVVMPDADLDLTVDAVMGAAYGSAGERCMAISALVAVGDVADELRERIAARVRGLRVGPGSDTDADMGPLVTRQHLEKVRGYVDLGVEEGAELVVDGRDFEPPAGCEEGFFLGGCFFDHVKPDMRSYRDEIFGPVLQMLRAESFDEAVSWVSDHPYGNGTCIFTRDGDAARTFTDRVEVGMVGVNVPIPVPMAFYSFGGWKASAFGDLNQHGSDGVRFYTKGKTVTTRWPTGLRAGADFGMVTLD